MSNIQPVGAACYRLTDVHVANNENNQPISTVNGEAIVTDSCLIDVDNSSKQYALSQNIKKVQSIDDVKQYIEQAQVEENPSRCNISVKGNNMDSKGHYALNIIDLLEIYPLAKDLDGFNNNVEDQYYLAQQLIDESLVIADDLTESADYNGYDIEQTKDESLTIPCHYLTDLLKIRSNIEKIKKLILKIKNKKDRNEIKRKVDKLLNRYLIIFHMLYNSFAVEINTLNLTLKSETYFLWVLQDLQIAMALLNKNDFLGLDTIAQKTENHVCSNALSDIISDICRFLTFIIFNINETYKEAALSMLLEEKNKQNIKKSLDILNNSLKFKLYGTGTEQLSDSIFLFYNLTNMIFGNNVALNKQIKLFRDSCNIYDSFPENIVFRIEKIENISRIYKVILNFSIFSELNPNKIDINAGIEFYELMSSTFYIGQYYNAFNSTFPDTVYGAEACPKYQEFISLMKIDHQKLTEYSKLLDNMLVILESNTEIKLDDFSAELPPVIFSSVRKIVDDYNKDPSLINKNILIKELRKTIAKLSFINNKDLHIMQDQTNDLKQIKRQQDKLARSELEKLALAKDERKKAERAKKTVGKSVKNPQKTKPASKSKPSVAIKYDEPPKKTEAIFENEENNITNKIKQLEGITASKNKVEALAAKLTRFVYILEQVQLVKPDDTKEEEKIKQMKNNIRQNKKFNFDSLITSFEIFTSFENFNFILEDIKELLDMDAENKLILQKNVFCKQIVEVLTKIIRAKQKEYNNSEPQLKNIHTLFITIPQNQYTKYKMSQETVSKCISMNNVFKNVPSNTKEIIEFFTKYGSSN